MRFTLIAHEVGEFGGQESAMASFVRYAQSRGALIDIVAFRADQELTSLHNVRILRVPRPNLPFVFRYIWFFVVAPGYTDRNIPTIACGAITYLRPNVVWMHYWHRDHLRVVGWFCSYNREVVRFVSQSVSRFVAWCAEAWCIGRKYTGTIVAVSANMATPLSSYYRHADVLVVPNSVHMLNDGSDIAFEDSVILFVGGEWGRKGLIKVSKACNSVGEQIQRRIHVRVAGNGSSRAVALMGKMPWISVDHQEWVTDMSAFYGSGDIFISASKYETFGMAGHEAMGHGKRMIVTNVHGLGESVAKAQAGILTDGSVADIGECVMQIIQDDEGSAAASRLRGLLYVQENFSTDKLRTSYDALLGVIAGIGGEE